MAIALANGIRIYYEWHGAESAPVLVLNNGILMNAASSWVYQTSALAAHYRVLQYDCRGQGQSEHPDAPYSMALHAGRLAACIVRNGAITCPASACLPVFSSAMPRLLATSASAGLMRKASRNAGSASR